MTETPRQERDRRAQGERQKAIEKYGPDALLPAGRPEFDMLDYMINEWVGMIRYCQMNAERFKMMGKLMDNLPYRIKKLLREAVKEANAAEEVAGTYADYFIEVQQKLRAAGLQLGQREQR